MISKAEYIIILKQKLQVYRIQKHLVNINFLLLIILILAIKYEQKRLTLATLTLQMKYFMNNQNFKFPTETTWRGGSKL